MTYYKIPYRSHSAPPSPKTTHSNTTEIYRFTSSAPATPIYSNHLPILTVSHIREGLNDSLDTISSLAYNQSIDSLGSQESVLVSSLAMFTINSQRESSDKSIRATTKKSRKRKGYRGKLKTSKEAVKKSRQDPEYRAAENTLRSIKHQIERTDSSIREFENLKRNSHHHIERQNPDFKQVENLKIKIRHQAERKP